MNVTVTIGNRHIPLEHIVAVEPFDPETQLPIPSERVFRARVILVNRDTFLMEDIVEDFSQRHGFLLLSEDKISVNAADIRFRVEGFVPASGFKPAKPYRSRLVWTDLDGEKQSKLLLSPPETVLAVAVRGEPEPAAEAPKSPPTRRARNSRRRALAPLSA